MWSFGLNYQGKISEVGDQAIFTRFFHIMWMPVIPLGSWFITHETGNWFRKAHGFRVGWNLKSILLAYVRRYSGLFFWGGSLGMFIELFDGEKIDLAPILGLLIFGAVWAIFMFIPGRAGSQEKYDRLLLGLATGVFAYPEWLPAEMAREQFAELETEWGAEYPDQDWKTALNSRSTDSDSIPQLFALAMYAGRLESGPQIEYLMESIRRWAIQEIPADEIEELYFEDVEEEEEE